MPYIEVSSPYKFKVKGRLELFTWWRTLLKGHYKWVSRSPSNILHKTSGWFSLCTGSFIDCNYVNTVWSSLVPLIMALISSSLLTAPFTFHSAIFIGVWSFPMSYRGTSLAVWRSGPDTTLLLPGSEILPSTVSSGDAPQPRTFVVEPHPWFW